MLGNFKQIFEDFPKLNEMAFHLPESLVLAHDQDDQL